MAVFRHYAVRRLQAEFSRGSEIYLGAVFAFGYVVSGYETVEQPVYLKPFKARDEQVVRQSRSDG